MPFFHNTCLERVHSVKNLATSVNHNGVQFSSCGHVLVYSQYFDTPSQEVALIFRWTGQTLPAR